jgi:hypothetical protein
MFCNNCLIYEIGLRQHVPWVHAHQLPSTFNALLATKNPENFWSKELEAIKEKRRKKDDSTPAPQTMYTLHKYRKTIMKEYFEYEKEIATNPLAIDHYDKEHEDSWMSRTKTEEGWWAYLRLRNAAGKWDEHLCQKYFFKTCQILKKIPSVNGPRPSNARCEGYCPSNAGSRRSTGIISFYRLAPGKAVKEHSGGDNHRLKCHLVIRAPEAVSKLQHQEEINPAAAYIQVSDTKRTYSTGDTFCFDDTFYHSVYNGGGIHENITRIVLDVAVWHPKLFHM